MRHRSDRQQPLSGSGAGPVAEEGVACGRGRLADAAHDDHRADWDGGLERERCQRIAALTGLQPEHSLFADPGAFYWTMFDRWRQVQPHPAVGRRPGP